MATTTAPTEGLPIGAGQPKRSLKALVLRGAAWAVTGKLGQHAIRLASNLILTRILFPKAFGLMALVSAIVTGAQMLSDFGVGPSIIQSKRGEDESFLATAWTLQVFRGVLLTAGVAALAWPFASFYGEPELTLLLPLAALTPFLLGFESTAMFVKNRRIELGAITVIQLGSQILGVAATIALAWEFRSVWVLPVGGIVGAVARVVASHALLGGPRARLAWDPRAARELVSFGKWIFASTILGFIANQGDRLILGRYLSFEELGLYSIAATLAFVMVEGNRILGQKVLFPLYARLQDETAEQLRPRVFKIRLVVLAASLPPLWVLAVGGSALIELLYDARYATAGWMLQVLACGAIVRVVPAIGPIYLAHGNSLLHFVSIAVRSIGLVVALLLGGWLWAGPGMVVGAAAAHVLTYPMLAWIARRYGVWFPSLDALGFGLSAAVVAAGLYLS